MLTLYAAPPSGNCYKILLLLAQLERPCEVVAVDLLAPRDTALQSGSPAGRVPLLLTPDGPLAESGAILTYLAEGSRFLPADGFARAQVLRWMFFEQNQHEPFIANARFWRSLAPDPETRADQLPFWDERGRQTLAEMEAHLGREPFFAAGCYTIADIALYAYTHVAGEGGFDLEAFPAVRAWIQRVEAQPGFIPMQPHPKGA